ncbi:hypothetical protein [Nonomuraea candida]|uniref:hypothetical protein n=1 Tax=Nonomuraea candida TaxID=359159 RepID=UPI0005B92E7C|nr:hypothetical protein [Nonomuraea candida]
MSCCDEYQLCSEIPQYFVTRWDKTGRLVETGRSDYSTAVEAWLALGAQHRQWHRNRAAS